MSDKEKSLFGEDFHINKVDKKNDHYVNVRDFGAKANGVDDDTQAIQRAINYLATTGGEIIFSKGNYFINGLITIQTKSNIKLSGETSAVLLVDGASNFLNIISSKNIEVKGLTFKDRSYTDDIYFEEVVLDTAAILAANVNANTNITVVTSNPNATISTNGTTPSQTTEYYIVSIAIPDSTKDYAIQTYDGIVSGENANMIKIRKYTDATTYKEYSLDTQNQEPTSAGNFKWHSNYIETNIIKIEILFPYSKINNSTNGSIVYDLSKIRLFKVSKEVPNHTDNFNISVQGSSKVTFKDNEFIGLKRVVISTPNASSQDLQYINNTFSNCFSTTHVQVKGVDRCLITNNRFITKLMSNTGREVYYVNNCPRAISGSTTSKNVTIRDNYAYGLYFGAEIWFSTNLIIEGFVMDKMYWGLSICNDSSGVINNCIFGLRDSYRYAIELAENVRMDINNVVVTGRSYNGVGFSFTGNKAGRITLTNIKVDSCFLFCQYTDNSVSFKNVEVKELLGVGLLGLQRTGSDFSLSNIVMQDCDFKFSTTLKVNNPAYASSFIRINSTDRYVNKIVLTNCTFVGSTPQNLFYMRTSEIIMNNVQFDSTPIYEAKLYIKDVNNKLSSIRNCQLYKMGFTEFYQTSANSKVVLKDNKVSSTVTIPSHANLLTDNNIVII